MKRIQKLKKEFEKEKLDAFLILKPINIFYFTNYKPDLFSFLLISDEPKLVVNSLEYQQAKERAKIDVIKSEDVKKTLKKEIKDHKLVGFEERYCIAKTYEEFRKYLVPAEELIYKTRSIKEKDEIKNIKKAIKIAKNGLNSIRSYLKPGITEKELAAKIEYMMKKGGSEGTPFLTIVASGKNSWSWHPRPSNKKIKKDEFVLVDIGATYNNYCSDLTRTFFLGEMNKKQKKIYDKVKEVSEKIREHFQIGKNLNDINENAKELFGKYEEYFVHSIGHGIGLEIHEPPIKDWKLKEEMVLTIEPGLYVGGVGGIRIENDFLIKKGRVVEL